MNKEEEIRKDQEFLDAKKELERALLNYIDLLHKYEHSNKKVEIVEVEYYNQDAVGELGDPISKGTLLLRAYPKAELMTKEELNELI